MSVNMVIAGFGGQGVLFAGKIVAYTGMIEDKQVSWLPSYGPEMRGGTANCSICVDDKPIGCPIVLNPEILVVMNRPSYDKFIDDVLPNGKIVLDETLIDIECARNDVEVYKIPATQLANDNDLHGLANIIMLGQVLKVSGFTTFEILKQAVEQCVPPKKQHLLEPNIKALKLGFEF